MINNKFKLNQYKYLFFDLFHTLVSPGNLTYPEHEWEYINVSKDEWTKHSINTYEDRAIGKISDPKIIVENIIKSIGKSVDKNTLNKMTIIRKSRFHKCLTVINSNIKETLKELYKRNYKLCLISNADVIDIQGWETSPISKYFEQAIFSCKVGTAKPNSEIYTIAINKMNAKNHKSLFIGDGGCNEFIGAKENNMDTMMTTEFIKHTWPEKIDTLKENADYVINNLSELLN